MTVSTPRSKPLASVLAAASWLFAGAAAAAVPPPTAPASSSSVSSALQAPSPAESRRLAGELAKLRDAALGGSGAYGFLRDLTTLAGPRLAGSASEHRAAAWAVDRLRAMGFENVHIESFPVPGWTRGEERAEVVGASPQALAVTALGGSGATGPDGLTAEAAVFRTYADMLAQPPGALAGRIVIVTQPMVRSQDGAGYGALSVMRFQGADEARKRGAAAYLVRSLATGSSRAPHTGATGFPKGVTPIPAGALGVPDAEQIDRLAAAGGPVRIHLTLTPTFRQGATSDTVVADITGRERPDEVVVIGGHLDSWDLATGAIDDGAGVAIATAAARLIRDRPSPPRRTVRLVLFGAEEIDYAGAAFAARRGAAELDRYVVASESDFGAAPVYAVALPAGAARSAFGALLADAIAPLPAFVSREPARFGGSDVAPLAAHVPQAELLQDGSRYFDIHHSADDTLDKVNAADLDRAVAAWAVFTALAADSDVQFRQRMSQP